MLLSQESVTGAAVLGITGTGSTKMVRLGHPGNGPTWQSVFLPNSILYGEGRILSPKTTCPRFSAGEFSSAAVQKSKLEKNTHSDKNMFILRLYAKNMEVRILAKQCCWAELFMVPTFGQKKCFLKQFSQKIVHNFRYGLFTASKNLELIKKKNWLEPTRKASVLQHLAKFVSQDTYAVFPIRNRIWIQGSSGSGFGIRIRNQGLKNVQKC